MIFNSNQYIDWLVTAKGDYLCGFTEPAAVYEIQLVAFNGNGDSIGNKRLVSLAESGTGDKNSVGELHYTHPALDDQFIVTSLFSPFTYLHKDRYSYIICM